MASAAFAPAWRGVRLRAGDVVVLDGTGSSDPDGDPLTFSWAVLQSPVGSTASFVLADTDSPGLPLDLGGAYRVALTVSDPEGASDQVELAWAAEDRDAINPCDKGDLGYGWLDTPYDVSLPNADIVRGEVTMPGDKLELSLQFCAEPFPTTATHTLTWCIDLDQNADTGGRCGWGELAGADMAIGLSRQMAGAPNPWDFVFHTSETSGLDPCESVFYDVATAELRVVLPSSVVSKDTAFNVIVGSAFGGSFGANEYVPDRPNFSAADGFHTNVVEALPPFAGVSICDAILPPP